MEVLSTQATKFNLICLMNVKSSKPMCHLYHLTLWRLKPIKAGHRHELTESKVAVASDGSRRCLDEPQ